MDLEQASERAAIGRAATKSAWGRRLTSQTWNTTASVVGDGGAGAQIPELFVDATVVLDPEARRHGSVKARPEMWWFPDLGR
jgi:hypothetical protein